MYVNDDHLFKSDYSAFMSIEVRFFKQNKDAIRLHLLSLCQFLGKKHSLFILLSDLDWIIEGQLYQKWGCPLIFIYISVYGYIFLAGVALKF